jgi:hypothetical protein
VTTVAPATRAVAVAESLRLEHRTCSPETCALARINPAAVLEVLQVWESHERQTHSNTMELPEVWVG